MIDFDALMSLDVAESMSFEPLPKGKYKVAVDSCELGESKKGSAMYTVDFVITEGAHASRQIRYWLVLQTKKGLHWDLPAFCNASGNEWPAEPTARTADYFYQVASDLVGKTAIITVDIEKSEYNGENREQNRIKKVEWDDVKPKKSKASKIEL